MDCKNIKEKLSAYMDKQVLPDEERQVKEHLAGCSHCAGEFDAMQRTWEALDGLAQVEPRDDYVSRFWTEVSSRKKWYEQILAFIKENFLAKKWAPAYVLIALIIGSFAVRSYLEIRQETVILAEVTQEDIEIVDDFELVENYEIIEDMELLEDWEIIESLQT